jgi:phage shock protein B
MEDIFVPLFAVLGVFVAFPWIIFHYVTKWKTAATITNEDENLLEELHHMARRLDDRMETIERIMAADNPDWRHSALPNPSADPSLSLEKFDERLKKERHPS